MNGQQTFSDIEYSMRKRTTKREAFLDAMDECIVWDEWCALIEPYYFKGKRGARLWALKKCCGCIFFRYGLTCPMRA